jgi:alkanesulfonate monooxygenase SsuD/methylene tetrahydromethanopterin reductase-like flavin-dependent oxidoreductase (luciferase family)
VQFHLYLPQMRMPFDRLVAAAQAAEAAGFTGIAGMDHLAPPAASGQPMYEPMVTTTWLARAPAAPAQGRLRAARYPDRVRR